MKEYALNLVGLRTVLRTPGEITVSENLRPFLCRKHTFTDCAIKLQISDVIPAMEDGGIWHGPEYYHCRENASRIFHCTAPHSTAFALTELKEDGNISIRVLPEYLSYFAGSEGIFNRIGMEALLLQHKGLLLHASLIQYENKAIAFAGPSGAGKSTQANIWHTYMGADIINGDRAALRETSSGWMAYGSPYAGTSGIYKNESAPLAAIVLLQQRQENRLCRLTGGNAFRQLFPELSLHHWDKAFVVKATDLCLELLEQIPVYLLECRPEEAAALLVKKGLGL